MDLKTANRLMELRKKYGYSQESLADSLGLSRQAISKWERGEASPEVDNLIALANLYHISLDELLGNKANEETSATYNINNKEDYNVSGKASVKEKKLPFNKTFAIFSSVTLLITIIVYILIGCLCNLWHPGWLLFFLCMIIDSIYDSIDEKNIEKFNYPILVTSIYLLVGFTLNIWHPTWVLFITIPLFYSTCKILKRTKAK